MFILKIIEYAVLFIFWVVCTVTMVILWWHAGKLLIKLLEIRLFRRHRWIEWTPIEKHPIPPHTWRLISMNSRSHGREVALGVKRYGQIKIIRLSAPEETHYALEGDIIAWADMPKPMKANDVK